MVPSTTSSDEASAPPSGLERQYRPLGESEGLIISEAVELDLPVAGLPVRMTSGLIDILVTLCWGLVIVWLAPWQWVTADVALEQALTIALIVAIVLALPVTLETALRGRTVGKLVLGLRTVRDDAGPISFRHALIRALAGYVELWLTVGGLALIVSATNDKGKRLGDMLAGTYVVRERVRLDVAPLPTAPNELAQWASTADIGVVPDGLAIAMRQFLTRASGMAPAARRDTANSLTRDLAAYVVPPPPQGAQPERVLTAVLHERRHRELMRAQREDKLRARLFGGS